MIVANPMTAVRMFTTSGQLLRCTIAPIGNWNMFLTTSVVVAHPLGAAFLNIVDIRVMIKRDDLAVSFPINLFTDALDPELQSGGIMEINNSNITLVRRTGGLFHNTSYQTIPFPRGTMFFWYYE